MVCLMSCYGVSILVVTPQNSVKAVFVKGEHPCKLSPYSVKQHECNILIENCKHHKIGKRVCYY